MRFAVLALVASLAAAPAAFAQEASLPLPGTAPPTHPEPAVVRGMDVSDAEGKIDWDRVAKSGIKFSFIRVSDGFHHDVCFARNWTGAKSAGVLRGAYQYFRASLDGAKQAADFLEQIPEAGDLPPVVDVETLDGVRPSKLAAELTKWVRIVAERTGRAPIVYTAPGLWGDWRMPSFAGDPLWVAHWNTKKPKIPAGWTEWTFWQYRSDASVPGIPGRRVDADLFHGTLDELRAFAATGAAPASVASKTATAGIAAAITEGSGQIDGPTLRRGQAGASVRRLQELLQAHGAALEVDGIFGEKTEAALRAFQKAHGIRVDGVAGAETWIALEQ